MPLTHEVVAEIMDERGWATIDDLATEIKRRGILDATWFEGVHDRALKADLRKLLRLRGDDDWPLFANVMTVNADGEVVRVYKQEALFSIDDYTQVVNDYTARANYNLHVAMGYQQRALARFNVQIPMPLEGIGPRATPVPVS